jgi:putative phosphoesterase
MTLAVFSDVHGNIYSLEKALKLMEIFKPDKYLFLGDMAGYYYYQNECIELLGSLDNLISLKGNHDEYFISSYCDKDKLKKLDDKYGKSYSILSSTVSQKSKFFFNNLQECEKNQYFEAYHGSPNNFLEDYVYKNTEINFQSKVLFIFLGHTHYPMKKKINDTFIINPGSIGQPRDFNQGSFSIVNLEEKKFENVRYDYDKSKLVEMIVTLKDKNYLLDVLERERK